MSRPLALCLVLLVLILTSHSDWKQPTKSDIEISNLASKEQEASSKREVVKEQVILSQEKRIYVLSELVKTLQQQLAQCQENNARNSTQAMFEPGPAMDVENH
ncbi:hypothetical protein KP509_14G006900 [Ceratopteris richardii]|uniref:Uncharacterized protein n=1 Tax=Ceratopteris richardii TaxID=49495 RepID=A0A8T2T974_CERRI|nr:hypothetical protein KP509_14G006900 [Ceratopteris richardii]